MKQAVLLCLLMAFAATVSANHGNKVFMKRPMAAWSNYPAGIKDVEIDVWPLGIYAQIDLTFTIGPTTNPSPQDSQEAVIFFDLPAGSYIHDSWLWLNPTTIISAELMERRKASEVYANIVKRRRDPSLLTNVLSQNYQLNIYPVASGYWRKVKISYSTPVRWQGGRANVPLPLDLLAAAQTPPAFALKVHANGMFYNPRFAERSFGTWLTGQTGNSQELAVPASGYTGGSNLTLSFEHYHQFESRLSIYPTGVNEGIYELIVPPTAPVAPRYVNFVVDHLSGNELYSQAELRRMLHSLVSTALDPGDYFNIHFRIGPAVSSVFNGWHRADSVGISNIANLVAGTSSNDAAFTALIKVAMLFTATGPATAETIILNGNYLSLNSTTAASVMTDLQNVPGIFNHKVHVIDYHYTAVTGPGSSSAGFHSLLADIAGKSKGSYFSPGGTYSDAYTQSTLYDFNMQDALQQSLAAGLQHTGIYNVRLPISGFTHSEYRIGFDKYYLSGGTYTESGRYYGTFSAADSVRIDYSAPVGLKTAATALVNISAGDQHFKKTWNYCNNRALTAYGNAYRQEIIDSSIRNRVLSDFTAFLALETGDTIKASVGQGVTSFPISIPGSAAQSGTVIAYPNPFRDHLTIESRDPIDEIRIYDIGGRLVRSDMPRSDKWIWNGADDNGLVLPPGLYLIRISSGNHSTAIRVNKLDH